MATQSSSHVNPLDIRVCKLDTFKAVLSIAQHEEYCSQAVPDICHCDVKEKPAEAEETEESEESEESKEIEDGNNEGATDSGTMATSTGSMG